LGICIKEIKGEEREQEGLRGLWNESHDGVAAIGLCIFFLL
jgi:hypothetical protein